MHCKVCGAKINDYRAFRCESCGTEPAVTYARIADYYAVILEEEKEFLWAKKGAEAGEAESMFVLATCYLNGTGTPIDIEEGYAWIKAAAEAGYTKVYTIHGDRCIQNGDLQEAEKWHMLAYKADKTNTSAMRGISTIRKMQGDLLAAIKWADKAANDDYDSVVILASLKAATTARSYLEDAYCLSYGYIQMVESGDIKADRTMCASAKQIMEYSEKLYSLKYGDIVTVISESPLKDTSPSHIDTSIPLCMNIAATMMKYPFSVCGSYPYLESPLIHTGIFNKDKKKIDKIVKKMRQSFAAGSLQETVLLLVDYREDELKPTGFLITDHNFYYSSDRNNASNRAATIPLEDIVSIDCMRDTSTGTSVDGCLRISRKTNDGICKVKLLLSAFIDNEQEQKLDELIEKTACINEVVGTAQKYLGVPVLRTYRTR